jgi:hypothetical protein
MSRLIEIGYSALPAYRAPGAGEANQAQTANHANSAAPSAATLSNTAAGYATLGGKFSFAAVAGAETDYALFGYQVPAGRRLIVSRVSVGIMNIGAAVATTAHVLEWSLGANASAVSLATTDGSGNFAPRRVPLGQQGFVVGAAIGTVAADLVRKFSNPLLIEAERFFHVILRMPVATATGSQVLRGAVAVDGRFE